MGIRSGQRQRNSASMGMLARTSGSWNLFEKTELKSKSVEEKCSYFLLVIGEKGREIYTTFDLPPETTTNQDGINVWARTITQLKKAFRDYCNPRKNITYERHKFNTRNQTDSDSID